MSAVFLAIGIAYIAAMIFVVLQYRHAPIMEDIQIVEVVPAPKPPARPEPAELSSSLERGSLRCSGKHVRRQRLVQKAASDGMRSVRQSERGAVAELV